MTYEDIAKKIPAEYRTEILTTNAINKAVAVQSNLSMEYLFNIWQIYVTPETLDFNCGSCLQNVLNNWREILPVLIKMEKTSNLIKSVK